MKKQPHQSAQKLRDQQRRNARSGKTEDRRVRTTDVRTAVERDVPSVHRRIKVTTDARDAAVTDALTDRREQEEKEETKAAEAATEEMVVITAITEEMVTDRITDVAATEETIRFQHLLWKVRSHREAKVREKTSIRRKITDARKKKEQ